MSNKDNCDKICLLEQELHRDDNKGNYLFPSDEYVYRKYSDQYNNHKEALRGYDPSNNRTQFDMKSICSPNDINCVNSLYGTVDILQFDNNESCKNITSRNELESIMKENFKNNKYKMRLDTDISDNYRESFVLRNDNNIGAYIQNELTPIYREDINNITSYDNTPLNYNYSGYRIKDNNYKANNSDCLPEFDLFRINDSEIIIDKDNEYNNDKIFGPLCCDKKQTTLIYNNQNDNKSVKKPDISINNEYNTKENILHNRYKDTNDITNIEQISDNLWNNKERFEGASNIDTSKHIYTCVLKAYAHALCDICLCNKDFAPWRINWVKMEENINKCGWNFEILDTSDADVAYVENKGEIMRFRIRDDKRFLPISIYTYVLCHELAHLANYNEYGHGPNFQRLMHLLEVAAYELGIIKPDKYPSTHSYTSNGTTILSKDSIKRELYDGIDEIVKHGGNIRFYSNLTNHIRNI